MTKATRPISVAASLCWALTLTACGAQVMPKGYETIKIGMDPDDLLDAISSSPVLEGARLEIRVSSCGQGTYKPYPFRPGEGTSMLKQAKEEAIAEAKRPSAPSWCLEAYETLDRITVRAQPKSGFSEVSFHFSDSKLSSVFFDLSDTSNTAYEDLVKQATAKFGEPDKRGHGTCDEGRSSTWNLCKRDMGYEISRDKCPTYTNLQVWISKKNCADAKSNSPQL